MKRAWRTLALAGGFSWAALTVPGAVADDPPTDEPPVQAEKPGEGETLPRAYGFPRAYGPAPDPAFAGNAPAAVVAAPSVVGDYRVGHIHDAPLSHIFWYSAYNPYLDELFDPMHSVVFGGRHAAYYAGYRHLYTPNWSTYYVPQSQCYAPGAYGYEPNRFSPYGPAPYDRPHGAYYGPGYYGANYPGGAYPVPAAEGINVNGFRYTGEPSVYSPFGVGSSSYFGAYGSAGY